MGKSGAQLEYSGAQLEYSGTQLEYSGVQLECAQLECGCVSAVRWSEAAWLWKMVTTGLSQTLSWL